MAIVNAVISSVKHLLGTYIVTINLTPEQKEQLAQGLRRLADEIHELTVDIVSESVAKTAKELQEE